MKKYKKALNVAGYSLLVVLLCMAGFSFFKESMALTAIAALAILVVPVALLAALLFYVDEKVRGLRKPESMPEEGIVDDVTAEYKKCPYCAEDVKAEAIVCRYCGKNFEEEDEKKRIQRSNRNCLSGCFLIIAIPILAIAAFIGYYSSHPIQSSQPQKMDRIQAYVIAEQEVENKLKAPRSARFCGASESKIIEYEPNKFTVLGYVDSENSFGAMMRSNFEVSFEFLPPDRWKLINIQIN